MEQKELEQLIKSANEGEASSQYDLAEYYRGIEDYFNTLVWYVKAAEQGNEKALELLFAPIEIEDKSKIVEIKHSCIIKDEEEKRLKAVALALEEWNKEYEREKEEERRKAEEKAKRKMEEKAKRAELERLRRLAEEAKRKAAEEETRRIEEEKAQQKAAEEARIKAEEEARRKAEEEEKQRQLIEYIREHSKSKIHTLLDDMVYVEGKSVAMRNSQGEAYIAKIDDFYIKKNIITPDDYETLLLQSKNYGSLESTQQYISRLSEVTGYDFSLPSYEQLDYALHGGINYDNRFMIPAPLINSAKNTRVSDEGQERTLTTYKKSNASFRIVCTDPKYIEMRKKAAEEAKRKEEEEAKRKAELDAIRRAEQEAEIKAKEEKRRREEERARIEAEEVKRKEEEKKRIEAEEAARKLAEEKARLSPYINSLFDNMIFVEGGEIRVNRIKGINIQTHTVVVNDFCILRGVVNHDAVSKFLYSSIEKNEYECFSEKVVKDFCYKFSRIVGMKFYVPSREQLEGAYNARPYAMSAPPHSREWLDGGGYLGYSSILQVNDAKTEGATFRIVTTDANFISELKQKNNWKSVVNEFLSIQETYEYKHGLFFGDKRKITIITQPITRRVWNAVMNHNGEMELNSNEFVPKKELGEFLKKLNESDLDLSQFDYLHNNLYANSALSVKKVIDDKGVYLYVKD